MEQTIKVELNADVVNLSMETMRSEFISIIEDSVEFDKTIIKQSKQDLNKGVLVAMHNNKPVASIFWNRRYVEGVKSYIMLCQETIDANSENPLYDFSEYDSLVCPKAVEVAEMPAAEVAEEEMPADIEEEADDETEEAFYNEDDVSDIEAVFEEQILAEVVAEMEMEEEMAA